MMLNRINSSHKVARLMGRYKVEVLFDVREGERLLELARRLQSDSSKLHNKGVRIINIEDLSNESLGTVMLHSETDKLGVICNVNMALCSLLGYTKTDLLNRRVTILMPELYARYHDGFLESYLNSNSESRVINNTIYAHVKTKANYIFPSGLTVRLV